MITITNKNIYHSDFTISESLSIDDVEVIDNKHIVRFLSDYVELGESITFKRLFEIISDNVERFNEIYFSALGGYKIDPFLQEIENNPTELIQSEFLEIYWHCDKYEGELSISSSLHGLSNKEDENPYAIDFVSLNNLKNYVVKINKDVRYFDYLDNKVEVTELGYKNITVFELFGGILNEISFHGGPQDKKERFKDIEESIGEINIKKLDTSEITTLEELMDKIESKDKYLVKYKNKSDRVEKYRVSNKKNLSKLKICLSKKLEIFDIIENSDENLHNYYKKLTDIEFDMQILYGEDEDIDLHKFWLTPKCTCPKIDNIEIYPCDKQIFDENCPIHKKPL